MKVLNLFVYVFGLANFACYLWGNTAKFSLFVAVFCFSTFLLQKSEEK